MFCNKCGSQLPDGTRFCKFCGAQLPTVPVEYDDYATPAAEPVPMPMQPPMAPPVQPYMAPPPAQPQMVQPPNDDDDSKKGKGGYVIIAVVAIILIATVVITAILLFGNKDDSSKDSEDTTATTQSSTLMAGGSSQATTTTTEPSTSDTTTEPSSESSAGTTDPSVPSTAIPAPNPTPTPTPTPTPEPQPPKVDLSGAEYVAKKYIESIDALNMKSACSYEVLGWYDFSYAFEELLLEDYESYYGDLTYDELYSIISEEIGYNINDVEDIFDLAIEQNRADNDPATVRVKSSKEISKSESTKFINATKNQMNNLNDYGIYSDDYNWSGFSSFAQVNAEATYSDGSKESLSLLLGYAYGDWYVIYIESNSEPIGLFSLYIIENWYS